MFINIMKSQEYIHGATVSNINGYDVISPVSLCEKKYKGHFKTGGMIRFISDAPLISVNISLMDIESGNYPHFGITAQSGIAYSYRIEGKKQWYNFDCAFGKGSTWKLDIKPYICVPNGKKYELMIYLPMLCYVSNFSIECADDYSIEPVISKNREYLFLGGINTFGIGATSSAFTVGNIFIRKTSAEITSIAFNYYKYLSFFGEFIFANIGDFKCNDIIFWECDNNNSDFELLNLNFMKILSFLLQNTVAKIVLWNQPTVKTAINKSNPKREFILQEIEKVKVDFPNRIAFCDNYGAWNNNEFDMYAYSINFINDYGYVWLYKRLNDTLEEKKWSI